MRRVLYVAGVLLLVAVASTSQASAAPAWHGEAGVPSNVDLSSVAALPVGGDDVVVAVGRDTSLKQAVIYRHVGGVWQQDPIYDSLNGIAPDSCLLSVSITHQVAWAVGSQGGGCPGSTGGSGKPLVVVFPAGGDALATRGATAGSNAWHFVTTADSVGPLVSISLAGKSGYIASAAGTVYKVDNADQTPPTPPSSSTAVSAPPSGTTTTPFVAAFDPGTGSTDGLGVSNSGNPQDVHVLQLMTDGSSMAAPATTTVGLAGVAALSSSQGIAIRSGSCTDDPTTAPCYWLAQPGGAWTAETGFGFGPASALNAVSITQSGSSVVEAVAGGVDQHGGAVWSRTGTSGIEWTRTEGLSATPLTGIAALAPFDIWAVGNSGTVLHYVLDPDAVPPPNPGTPPASPTPTPTGGTSPAKTASAPGPPPHVTVVQPPPKRTRGHKGHHPKVTRLVSHVHVKVDVGRLIVIFHLSARAKIQLQGRTGGRLVAAAGPRTMRKGRARMVLRYKGAKPPAQLRIIAHPARKK